jgi:hypothetical protein
LEFFGLKNQTRGHVAHEPHWPSYFVSLITKLPLKLQVYFRALLISKQTDTFKQNMNSNKIYDLLSKILMLYTIKLLFYKIIYY